MTIDERLTSYKYSVLQHAYKNKNIADTCRFYNLSRTTFYEWQTRFKKFGYLGLRDKERSKPKMPNQIKPDKQQVIYNYIVNYPTHGPVRIANELAIQGVIISPIGIYNVLKRT